MKKYQIKSELYWRLKADKLTVYSTNTNLRKELLVDDPEETFNFLNFIGEARSESELAEYPFLTKEEKTQIIDFLIDHQYLRMENAKTPIELERLDRFVSTFPHQDFDVYQEELNQAKVLIIGLGTAGSYQLEMLHKIGLKHFTIIDGDQVALKNLSAQNYLASDVGHYKADVIKKRYESSSVEITSINEFVRTYRQLKELVDLEAFQYVIDCADDHYLALNIVENLFHEFPKAKLFLSGYTVLQQCSFMITAQNWKELHSKLATGLTADDGARDLCSNSGAIFNSWFLTFAIAKMIFDDLFEVGDADYAFADFQLNTYFVGNKFAKNLYSEFETKNKRQYRFVNHRSAPHESPWIGPLNEITVFDPKLVRMPILSAEKKRLLAEPSQSELLKHNLMIKDTYQAHAKVSFSEVEQTFLDFLEKHVSLAARLKVEQAISNNQVYIGNKSFLRRESYTLKTTDKTLVYSVEDPQKPTTQTLSIIHELLHLVYFDTSENTRDHENFVRAMQTTFFLDNLGKPVVRQLAQAYLQETVNAFIGMAYTLEYEKAVLRQQVPLFFDQHPETQDNVAEFLNILNHYLNRFSPFELESYYQPIIDNTKELTKLEELLYESSPE